jgi:FkbM family methyltransferase
MPNPLRRRRLPDPILLSGSDIAAGYRLLLGREPDPDGQEFWGSRVGKIAFSDFVGAILDTREFHLGQYFKRLAPEIKLTQVELPGRVMLLDPEAHFVGRAIAHAGAYEPNLTAVISDMLAPGMTFVDVGANVGWHSLMAAERVGSQGFVLAVEADPTNADLLIRSVRANGFSNIVVLPVALSDRVGTAILQQAEGSNAALYPSDFGSATGDHLVSTFPLDTFDRLVSAVDVLKVDVEGAEALVLSGASELVDKHRPVIFLEFSPGMMQRLPGASVDSLEKWIEPRSFELALIPSSGGPIPVSSITEAAEYVQSEQLEHIDLMAKPS